MVPAPGEPGSETWKDKAEAWRTGGGALYVTGSYDPQTNLTYWGTGNPAPRYDSAYRPGDNLFTESTVAFDAATGKMQWYFQYTANDNRDYDASGSQIIVDGKVNGEDRKLIVHADRDGFNYTIERLNGQFLKAVQYGDKVTWTKGIDPKTGKPVDYDPNRDVQLYAGIGQRRNKPGQESCPWYSGSPTFFPPTFDAKRMIAYVSGAEGCSGGTIVRTPMDEQKDWVGLRMCCQEQGRATAHGALWALDVRTGKIVGKAQYPVPNESGMLSTDGDLVFTGHSTGNLAAYDADTVKELWSFSLGTPITAPPMTFAVGGRQYIAVNVGGDAGLRGAVLYQPSAFVAVFGLP